MNEFAEVIGRVGTYEVSVARDEAGVRAVQVYADGDPCGVVFSMEEIVRLRDILSALIAAPRGGSL